MWRRLLLITGLAALVAFFLRRRTPPEPVELPVGLDPAEELRRKLDDVRGREEPVVEPAPERDADLDERRRDVHARARAAADEMKGSSPA